MIDTIKISHLILKAPNPEKLEQLGWRKLFDKITGLRSSWFYKEDGNQHPYLSLFIAPDAKVYLSATVSLPAFIFGSNVRLPNQHEITQALESLSRYVSERSGLEFDALTAIVWEAHFTKDYFVGEVAMRHVISKLAEMNIPRFSKGRYSETTLYFHSKGAGKQDQKPRTICIYDKHEDCINKSFSKSDTSQAEGMMRLEFRYKTTDAVKRLVKGFQLSNRQAQTVLTESVSNAALASIEEQILLLFEETNSQDCIISLTEKYGKRRTASLIQFLVYQHLYKDQFYKIKALDFSRSAYYNCQRDCREAGVTNLFDISKTKIQVSNVS